MAVIPNNVAPLDPRDPCPTCGVWWTREATPKQNGRDVESATRTASRDWIQTRSGVRFWLREPERSDIRLRDIAAGLSKLCRYNGQTIKFYSVAEHSYRASLLVPDEYALAALLHDASEAYLGDVSTPLKAMLPEYREIEALVQDAIYERFNALPRVPRYGLDDAYRRDMIRLRDCCLAEIKAVDWRLLATEAPLLYERLDPGWSIWLTGHTPIEGMTLDSIGWKPDVAEHYFMERAAYLCKRKRGRVHEAPVARLCHPYHTDMGHIHWHSFL